MGFLKENFLNKKAFLDVSDYNLLGHSNYTVTNVRKSKIFL
jgi:hypothetical protein